MRKVYLKSIMMLLLSMICGTAFGQVFTVDGINYDVASSTNRQVIVVAETSDETNYNSVTNLVIPEKVVYEGVEYTIVSIGSSAFKNAKNLKTVNISAGVTKIGSNAFMSCVALETVSQPSSVKELESQAFYGCEKLETINLENIEKIGEEAFYKCSALREVMLGDVEFTGQSAFAYCSSLLSVQLDEGITALPLRTFYCCFALKTINFPKSLQTIDIEVFSSTALESVALDENVESVGVNAFATCLSLKAVDFSKCSRLTLIATTCFYNDNVLQTVKLPESIKKIGNNAFGLCTKLSSINLNDNITEIGDGAFKGCNWLLSANIPSSLTKLGKQAFMECYRMEAQVELHSLTSLGEYAFCKCYKLQSVDLTGCRIREIPQYAFNYCNEMTAVELPDYVRKIATNSFSYCSKLRQVNIPEGVTELGTYVFYNDVELLGITLPSTLTKMGDYVFGSCNTMAVVNCFAQTPPTLGNSCFSGLPEGATLNVPVGTKDAYMAASQWKNFSHINDVLKMSVTVDFSKARYATLTLPFECAIPENMKVYSITGYEGNVLIKTEVTDMIQANTPYLVYCSGTETELTLQGVGTVSSSWPVNGLMAGCLLDQIAYVNDFVLQIQDGKLGFYRVDKYGFNVDANRAVLRGVSLSGAKSLFIDGDVTAVENIEPAYSDATVDVYTINGVMVRKGVNAASAVEGLPAGIYVMSGKKMIVK